MAFTPCSQLTNHDSQGAKLPMNPGQQRDDAQTVDRQTYRLERDGLRARRARCEYFFEFITGKMMMRS
jgi:hypothetical protein